MGPPPFDAKFDVVSASPVIRPLNPREMVNILSSEDASKNKQFNGYFLNSAVGVFYVDYGIQDFFSFVQKRYRTKNPFQFNLLFPSPATDFLIYIHKNPSQGSSAAGNGSA